MQPSPCSLGASSKTMEPKLVKVSSLGYLAQTGSGKWRVRAKVDGKDIYGPERTTSKLANDDKTKARCGATRADFVKIVKKCTQVAHRSSSSRSWKAHTVLASTAVADPQNEGPLKIMLRTCLVLPSCRRASCRRPFRITQGIYGTTNLLTAALSVAV